MCLESMNVMRGRESWKTNLFNVKSIFAYLDSCNESNSEVTRSPYLASMSYFAEPSAHLISAQLSFGSFEFKEMLRDWHIDLSGCFDRKPLDTPGAYK